MLHRLIVLVLNWIYPACNSKYTYPTNVVKWCGMVWNGVKWCIMVGSVVEWCRRVLNDGERCGME